MKKIFDIKKVGALALGLVAFVPAASAQDEVETTIAADVVNQYIWRGQSLGEVSLQPTLGIGYKGLSLTAWGSVGISQPEDTKEFDLTLAYETGGFHIGVTDYWFNTLDKPVLRAPKAEVNARSRQISLSNGMRLVRTEKKAYVSGILDSELWEITREEWNALRRS